MNSLDEKLAELSQIFEKFSIEELKLVLDKNKNDLNNAINALIMMNPGDLQHELEALSVPPTPHPTPSATPSHGAPPSLNFIRLPPEISLPPPLIFSESNSPNLSNTPSANTSPENSPSLRPIDKKQFQVGLGRIGFNVHHHNFMGEKSRDLKEVFENYSAVGSVINLSLQWDDSEFVNLAPMLTKMARQTGLSTLVSLSLFQETDNGIEGIQLPKALQGAISGKPSFSSKPLADNLVETICLIAQSKPNFISVASDINSLALSRPDEFQRFLAVYKIAYREAKKISPQTKIFVSFQYELFKQVKTETLKLIYELKPELDALGISSHPYDLFGTTAAIPADHFKELAKFVGEGLPVLVTEIGWPSDSLNSDDEQLQFLRKLPVFFEGVSPSVVCWDLLGDPSDAGKKYASRFVFNGLLTKDGNRKKAYFEWERLQKNSPQSVHKSHKRNVSDQVPLPPPIAGDRTVLAPLNTVLSKIQEVAADAPLTSPSASQSISQLNINFYSDAPRMLKDEIKPYCIDSVLTRIRERSYFPEIHATGWPDLLISRMAYLVSQRVHDAAVKEAVVLDLHHHPTDFVDQGQVDSLIIQHLDTVALEVLGDSKWLESKKAQYNTSKKISTEIAEDQGPRMTMEDRQISFPFLNELFGMENTRMSFFGVFDGHGGSNTADYVASHLYFNLMRIYQLSEDKDIKICVREAFLQTDLNYARYAERKSISPNMGSTAVIGLIIGSQLFICWAGDSEACLVNDSGDVFKFVTCHKPKYESEKQRIEEKGGFVSEHNGLCRVNGVLAVSRAFGDLGLKFVVTAEPEISTYTMKGNESFLLLACDGLWDVMTPFDVEEFVDNHRARMKGYDAVSLALVQEARRRKSTDNITIVFVRFSS